MDSLLIALWSLFLDGDKEVIEFGEVGLFPDVGEVFNSSDVIDPIKVIPILILFLLLFGQIGEPDLPFA